MYVWDIEKSFISLVWKDRANDIKAGVALGILILKSVKMQRAQVT